MPDPKQNETRNRGGFHVQFNLPGLVVFTVSLIVTTGVLSYTLARAARSGGQTVSANHPTADPTTARPPQDLPPWGELITYDTQMERPEEFAAMELGNLTTAVWTFEGMSPDKTRELMTQCGLTGQQTDRALSLRVPSSTAGSTTLKPDDELIFSLSPEARAKLYGELAKNPANHYMRFPFCFPGDSFDEIANTGQIESKTASLIRSVLYRRGEARFLSDPEVVMRRVPSEEQRERLIQALSSQSAVLARLRVRPTTDIDKLLGYWASAPQVRFTNLRPLLESLKRLDDGGTISLMYLLPPFARERLYTYPLPSQSGDPPFDCHWSTMNFFNDTPDNRFADPGYTAPYLTTNYYPVAKPTRYGDLIFLLDDKGNAFHSAVYLADDIIFTKNGNNYMEPWMLMRLKNLLATYSVAGPPRVIIYRHKSS